MHHARCLRFLAALALVILTMLCPRQALGQTRCSVEQEQFPGLVTGRFTVGTVTASLTLPYNINADDPIVLLMEVSAPGAQQSEQQLVIRSGYETVRLRDGAALHVVHRPGERLIFSAATLEGRELCSWEPLSVFAKKKYRLRNSLRATSPYRDIFGLHITGEPIALPFEHAYSDGHREFRLDDVPARILMESRTMFLLRDPNPIAGVRTLESQGDAVPLHFVDAEKRLLPSSKPNREILEVTLRGVRLGSRQSGLLLIYNFKPQTVRLACGARTMFGILHLRSEWSEDAGLIFSPLKVRGGSVTLTCGVRLLQSKPASLRDFALNVSQSVSRVIPFLPSPF